MTDHELFVLTKPIDFTRDVRGTPWVDSLDERTSRGRAKRVRYSRASGYAEQVRSSFTLHQRDLRLVLIGAALLGVEQLAMIVDLDPADPKSMELVDAAVEQAFNAVGARYAAERGTAVHAVLECADRCWPIDEALAERCAYFSIDAALLIDNWHAYLADNGFEVLAVEFPGVNDQYRAAGSLDRIVRCHRRLVFGTVVIEPGAVIVVDFKSGGLFLGNAGVPAYWSGYTAQLALYASMQPYFVGPPDRRGRWPWDVDQTSALIAHVDVEAGCRLTTWHVDLAAGRELCELALAARQFEARCDLFVAGH